MPLERFYTYKKLNDISLKFHHSFSTKDAKNHRNRLSFLPRNAIQKHNQHSYKQVRATLKRVQERITDFHFTLSAQLRLGTANKSETSTQTSGSLSRRKQVAAMCGQQICWKIFNMNRYISKSYKKTKDTIDRQHKSGEGCSVSYCYSSCIRSMDGWSLMVKRCPL